MQTVSQVAVQLAGQYKTNPAIKWGEFKIPPENDLPKALVKVQFARNDAGEKIRRDDVPARLIFAYIKNYLLRAAEKEGAAPAVKALAPHFLKAWEKINRNSGRIRGRQAEAPDTATLQAALDLFAAPQK